MIALSESTRQQEAFPELPAFYRDHAGDLGALLCLVSESGDDLLRDCAARMARLLPPAETPTPPPAADTTAADTTPRGVGQGSRWLRTLASRPPAPRRGWSTQDELVRWFARCYGVTPRLWPLLRLEPLGRSAVASGPSLLRVARDAGHLVVSWPASADDSVRAEALARERPAAVSSHAPALGLRVQLVRLMSAAPANPYVEGRLLSGEVVATWQ